jgi:hypothetical protein
MPGGKDKLIASHNTPEFHEKQSAALTEYYADPENRQKASDNQAKVAEKHSQSLKDAWERNPRCWITDGVESKHHFVSEPIPEGWRIGRTMAPKRPRLWITDGTNSQLHFADLPIPEGWHSGRIRGHVTEES